MHKRGLLNLRLVVVVLLVGILLVAVGGTIIKVRCTKQPSGQSISLTYEIVAPPGFDLKRVMDTCKIDSALDRTDFQLPAKDTDTWDTLQELKAKLPTKQAWVIGLEKGGKFYFAGSVYKPNEGFTSHYFIWQCASKEEVELHLDLMAKFDPATTIYQRFEH